MPDRTFSLSGGPLAYKVAIDGHDVSKAFRRVVIDVDASPRPVEFPQVTAELAITAIEVTGLGVKESQFVVTLSDEAKAALIALGWAPPREIPWDRREEAREWITGFMAATDEDRVNTVALLLMAADDGWRCAKEHRKAPPPDADEEINLDEDWDSHLRGGDNRYEGAVLISGADCCCGGRHTRDYTPAKARRIASRLTALAEEAEKVEPAPLPSEDDL